LLLVFSGNLLLNTTQGKKGEVLFSVQQRMVLSDEIKLIDWIYKESRKEEFAINTITNPLFINTTWAYLFNWYGRTTYGYMPAWFGYPQVDVFGATITLGEVNIDVKYNEVKDLKNKLFFLIIEPKEGIPENYIRGITEFENTRSSLVERKKFGTFFVEKRIITRDIPFSRDDVYRMIAQPKSFTLLEEVK